MPSEFLPRAHSKRLGQLDVSNWKNLGMKHNIARVDPAIRDIVLLLNDKGYITFSSCSGGHIANLRRKFDRHESGYIAFSPPSMAPFALYVALRETTKDFMLEAEAVIHDGNGDRRETMYTQLDWQLVDQRKSSLNYYNDFFAKMKREIRLLPKAPSNHGEAIVRLLGQENRRLGSRIVAGQMRRFRTT